MVVIQEMSLQERIRWQLKVGCQATRGVSVAESEFYVKVTSALILFGATSMMMIDFGNVGQCVFGTQSSSTKSVMRRHVLSIQECVESGEIRTEKRKRKYNTADKETEAVSVEVLQKHLKMLEWNDAKDISGYYHGGENDYRTGVFNMDLKLRQSDRHPVKDHPNSGKMPNMDRNLFPG